MYLKTNYKKVLITLFIIFSLLISCTKNQEKHITKDILKIYNWEDYIGSDTIEKFTQKSGITVELDYYEDEEDMFAFIRSDLSAYDLVVASDDLVREMLILKILNPIDLEKIPNFENIDEKFKYLPFDPLQEYSIPYLWGTTGLIINTKYVENNESWDILFSEKYKNKIALLNNSFEVFSIPLKLLGKSINSNNIIVLESAGKLLLKQKEINKGYFDAIDIQNQLLSEELWAAQLYSGEALAASDENEDLLYIIPKEGAPIWLDTFVIPRDAKNIEAAYEFLDFILDPQINASIASELWYATANEGAFPYIDSQVLDSVSVYPDQQTLERCEYYSDNGTAMKTIIEYWNKLGSEENEL